MYGTPWFGFAMVEASCRLEKCVQTCLSNQQDYCYCCKTILWWTGVYHTCRHILYCTYSCYDCLSEDEPSGLKCTWRWCGEKWN